MMEINEVITPESTNIPGSSKRHCYKNLKFPVELWPNQEKNMNKSWQCHTYKLSSRWIGVLFAVFSCIDVNLLFFLFWFLKEVS